MFSLFRQCSNLYWLLISLFVSSNIHNLFNFNCEYIITVISVKTYKNIFNTLKLKVICRYRKFINRLTVTGSNIDCDADMKIGGYVCNLSSDKTKIMNIRYSFMHKNA